MTFARKSSLALAVLACSIAAQTNAATIYSNDKVTYNVKGDFQIQLRKKAGNDQKLDVEFDDLELKNSIVYKIDEQLSAFGQLDFSFDSEGNDQSKDSSKLEEAYVGLDFDGTRVSIGRQNLAGDEFGVEAAYETHTAEDRFEQVADKGDDVIRVETQLGQVTLIGSALVGAETSNNAAGEAIDLFASTDLSGLKLAAAYQNYNDNLPGSEDQQTWGVSAAYNFGSLKLAADYSTTDTGSQDAEVTNLVASYKFSDQVKTSVGVVWSEEGNNDAQEWYANATYTFAGQKNVSLFAEIADTDETDVSLGYMTGLQIKF
ncbi:porin [Neptuniibacter halophilus]|uniref:porin n=1 Tax=Neptuniibacter halophilus TaxID=651666 RepID=UPI0025729EA9|nr:porin [Neptuniibacter halophilus]